MAKIIYLEDHKEVWLPVEVICVACSHKWVAVVHKDRQTKLECPDCGELKGATLDIMGSE